MFQSSDEVVTLQDESSEEDIPENVITYLTSIQHIQKLKEEQNKIRDDMAKLRPQVEKWLKLFPHAEIRLVFTPEQKELLGNDGKLMMKVDFRREQLSKTNNAKYIAEFMKTRLSNKEEAIKLATECSDYVWNARAVTKEELLVHRCYKRKRDDEKENYQVKNVKR